MLPDPKDQSYWSRRLVECYDRVGETVYVHESVEMFAKVIIGRILHNKELLEMPVLSASWSEADKKIMIALKSDIREALLIMECDFTTATKWLQVLNLPKHIENYFMSHLLSFYEIKDFLNPMEAEWLMELIPSVV
jgi:hypothetical protein